MEFANIIYVSQGSLSEIEQDKYKPSYDVIIAINKRFNTEIEWPIYGDEKIVGGNIFNMEIYDKDEI
ncbi:helix-turn-helix domain-containing protein [Paenibacillus glacialis]|uniref:helix-turn-helix domain-containing protein n=1 Tax=Paenibacillus glacialis TaxID=494026 RepID=UPI0009FC2A7D|nr:helix-turn-helix transcriptional regulator [Paenibacillus glacialis]